MKYSILYNAVNNIKNDEEVNEIIKDIHDCISDGDDVTEAIDCKLIYAEDILRIAISTNLYSEEIERMIVEYIYSNDIDIIIDESDDSLNLLDNVSTLSKEEDLIKQLTEKVYNYIIETIE